MRTFACAAALVALSLSSSTAGAEPAPVKTPQAVLDRIAPSIVTLKFVWRSPTKETAWDLRGALVDPTGLVLTFNDYLIWKDAVPVGMRVVVAGDPTEHPAVIAVRDADRKLAYVQILGLGAKKLPAIDLAAGAEPRVGQDVLSVWRDDAAFDHSPWLLRAYVSSRLEHPRASWGLGGDSVTPGLPVFDEAGLPLGVAIEDGPPENPAEGGTGKRTLLLPLAEVVQSVAAARRLVPDAVAKATAAAGPASAPASPPTEAPQDASPAAPQPSGPR
jgi:hypothetical protein